MKYLLLDGINVDVKGCSSCPLCYIHTAGTYEDVNSVIVCRYTGHEGKEEISGEPMEDHYMDLCPLSPYQSLHHLYVSAKCIYQTIKTLYDNFMEWWHERK